MGLFIRKLWSPPAMPGEEHKSLEALLSLCSQAPEAARLADGFIPLVRRCGPLCAGGSLVTLESLLRVSPLPSSALVPTARLRRSAKACKRKRRFSGSGGRSVKGRGAKIRTKRTHACTTTAWRVVLECIGGDPKTNSASEQE